MTTCWQKIGSIKHELEGASTVCYGSNRLFVVNGSDIHECVALNTESPTL